MRGRATAAHNGSAGRPCCGDCLFSPECPVCDPDGAGVNCGIEVASRVVHRGDRLFHHGKPFDCIYMVLSGMVKTCTTNKLGDEQVVGFYSPCDLLGLDAIHGGRYVSNAIVLETSMVCALPFEPLSRLCAGNPRVLQRLLSKMSQRIIQDEHRLSMLAQRSASRRMASFLLSLADARSVRGLKSDEFILPMPRSDIASYLAFAAETVSRTLTALQHDGLIDVRHRRMRIRDEKSLRSIAWGLEQESR